MSDKMYYVNFSSTSSRHAIPSPGPVLPVPLRSLFVTRPPFVTALRISIETGAATHNEEAVRDSSAGASAPILGA